MSAEYEADRLREAADYLCRVRHLLIRYEEIMSRHGHRATAAKCDELESELLKVEDWIAASADRLDPPPCRETGRQMILRWGGGVR